MNTQQTQFEPLPASAGSGRVDWRTVDWRLSDASLADSLGVTRQRVNKARQRCAGEKAIRVKKTRRELDDMIDEMVGIISHYDPRTGEELSYNEGVKDMANTFRGWTLRARLDSQNDQVEARRQ